MKPIQFISFIKREVSKSKMQKDIYGDNFLIWHILNFVQLKEHLIFDGIKELYYYIDSNDNLDLNFILTYKSYNIAEVTMELKFLKNLSFIANQELNNRKEFINKRYENNNFNTIYKFELKENSLILQAKNEDLDFELKVQSDDIEIDLDFIMPISEIELFDDKEKHTHLFNTLCGIIDDKQLEIIANADYGYGAEECFKELKQIQQTQTLPKELTYEMSEVLSLSTFSRSTTEREHYERMFVCVVRLLGNYDNTLLENDEDSLTAIFMSIEALNNTDLLKQSRAFFYYKLQQSRSISEVILLTYLISGIYLLLKEENDYKKMFKFLNKIELLKQTDYEYDTSFTAERVKISSEIMLKNIDFIIDNDLKNKARSLINSMILLCKERYDKQAKEAYLKRIFTQEEQRKVIDLLPQIIAVSYNERDKFLVEKDFNKQQVKLITRSIFKAEIYEENYDHNYEVELSKNVFFDEVMQLLDKK